MLDHQFERPAVVLLSAMWTLAVVLSVAAFAVSAIGAGDVTVARSSQRGDAVGARPVEIAAASTMLREPGLAISKDKLD